MMGMGFRCLGSNTHMHVLKGKPALKGCFGVFLVAGYIEVNYGLPFIYIRSCCCGIDRFLASAIKSKIILQSHVSALTVYDIYRQISPP